MAKFLKWNPTEKVFEEQEEAGSSGVLGTPTDGTFADGFFPFQAGVTSVTQAVDDMNELLAAIAPDKPGNLGGDALLLSGTTPFTAKLPSGLSGVWGAFTPGDTITNLIVDGTYTLASPGPSNAFFGQLISEPTQGGVITHILDTTPSDARPVTAGVGITGTVEITDISTFNTVWRKINAQLNIVQTEGLATHELDHDVSGTSLPTPLYFDDVNTAPSFSATPSVNVTSPLFRQLSGISYLKEGTEMAVSYTAGAGIFTKAYHPTAVSTVAVPSATTVNVNPSTPPAVGDTFPVIQLVTLAASNIEDCDPQATVTLRKPDGQQTALTTAIPDNINTYASGASTTTSDAFVDEIERLELGTATPWDSTAALADGNLQVGCGLRHGLDGDYPGHTSIDAAWERMIASTSASNGTLTLAGINPTVVAQHATGTLNIFIQLETDSVWFDLGLDLGLNNGTGSGDSFANSRGAKIQAVGNDLQYSFGLFNTGNNSNEYRLRVVYRGANGLQLTSIQGP